MTDVEEVARFLLPMVISGVIAVLVLGLQRITRSGDNSIAQAVRIESVDNSLKDIKTNFERIEKSIRDIWIKVDEMAGIVKLNSWRLDKLEKNGGKSPLK